MITTPAWLLVGVTRTLPGALSYDGSRLRFASAEDVVFDVGAAEVEQVKWPKLWMGGGCKIAARGEEYRVSFVKPNGAPDITDELLGNAGGVLGAVGSVGEGVEAAGSLFDAKKGREAGKAWKDVLGTVVP